MSPVSLAMDGLLAVLLMTAVAVGVRLNGKLKLLRDGQGQFVRAVGDLDSAAKRAEAGLQALRAASEETHDALLARIETARGLLPRLDRASEEAAAAAARLDEGVRAADSAARRAGVAADGADAATRRVAARMEAREEPGRRADAAVREPSAPIPFPHVRREPVGRSLADALRTAERIVEAEAPSALPPPERELPSPSVAVEGATVAGDRLSRFVARRRGARTPMEGSARA